MRRWIIIVGAVGLVVALLVVRHRETARRARLEQAANEAPPVTVAVSRGKVEQTVTAPGVVIGTGEQIVSVPLSGRLAVVSVRPGDRVVAGQTLARLASAPLEEALEQARHRLERARAEHAYQLDRARLESEIAAARLAQSETLYPDVAAEAAAVRAAESALQGLWAGPDQADMAALQAQLEQAQAQLAQVQAGTPAEALIAARAELANAEAALQQAQAAYDQVAWAADIGARPESLQLQQATNAYEAARARYDALARAPEAAAVAAAQAAVREAEARLVASQRGPATDDVAQAEAALAQAQVAYAAAGAERAATDQTLAILRAEQALAERTRRFLEEGLDPQYAQAVARAEADLARAEVTAPFAGVVLEVLATPGESLPAGAAVLRLADPAAIEVRTTVIEEDLPLIQVGQSVDIFFDAHLDEVAGVVDRIVPRRVEGEERPLYHVFVAVAAPPAEIVAGMTADASIIIARQPEALRLPRAVLRFTGEESAEVTVWDGRTSETRAVQVGLRGDVYVEIVSGLAEGERAVGE